MRHLLLVLVLAASPYGVRAQEPPKPPAPASQVAPAAPSAPVNQETITQSPSQAAAPSETGFMEPAQLKALLHKIWLAEYRTNDLLTEVHAENWKISEEARNSFLQTLANLRKALASQEDWRVQFEQRPDSIYLGYETFIAMTAVQPRLDAVGRSVSQYENRSLGAQYSQAGNQLFDLQQALQPVLEYLLRNQDAQMLSTQNNLASCQSQLGFAMHNRIGPATPMKNIFVDYRAPRRSSAAGNKREGKAVPQEVKPAEKKVDEKAKPKAPEPDKVKK